VSDDQHLIEQAMGGDTAAFGQLVRRYQDRLFTGLVHVVSCPEEAEDVVQDAFVQAMRKLGTFRGDSSFFTWLYRIAINIALHRHRRRRPETSIDAARVLTGDDPVDPGDHPQDRMLREERAAAVTRALAQLSEEFRVVLVLRDLEGFDYQSIAKILGVSLGTVRSRLHRARSLMRDHLRDHHHGTRAE
jgi:RNA polymerase sigma-70 factor (ECF subfamily)